MCRTGPRTPFPAGTSRQGGCAMPRNSLLRHEMSRPLAGHHLLTFARPCGLLEAPNQTRRSKRLSDFPRVGRSLAAQSAFAVKVPAGRLSGGLLSHIGGVVTSSIREDWRLRLSRGALRPRPFFIPNQTRYPMNLSQSPASHGPELTTSTATSTAAACRRVFRRKGFLKKGEKTCSINYLEMDN